MPSPPARTPVTGPSPGTLDAPAPGAGTAPASGVGAAARSDAAVRPDAAIRAGGRPVAAFFGRLAGALGTAEARAFGLRPAER